MLEIIRIIPKLEDYSCPICLDLAFKPSEQQLFPYFVAIILNITAKKLNSPSELWPYPLYSLRYGFSASSAASVSTVPAGDGDDSGLLQS